MKAQGRRLWLVVAGMDNPAKLDPEYLKSYLFALKGRKGKGEKVSELHLPDLEVPLRSCRSVLEQAGLQSGIKTLAVSSGYGGFANVQYRIPSNLIDLLSFSTSRKAVRGSEQRCLRESCTGERVAGEAGD